MIQPPPSGAPAQTALPPFTPTRISNVAGLAVPKGDYTLYVNVKDPDAWELVINKQTGQWGT